MVPLVGFLHPRCRQLQGPLSGRKCTYGAGGGVEGDQDFQNGPNQLEVPVLVPVPSSTALVTALGENEDLKLHGEPGHGLSLLAHKSGTRLSGFDIG